MKNGMKKKLMSDKPFDSWRERMSAWW